MIKAMILSFLVSWFMPIVATEKTDGRDQVRGSENRITETYKLETFTTIELSVPADMNVTIGEPTPLTIEADDNILPLIKVEVIDGRLIISNKQSFKSKKSPKINVTVAQLDGVSVIGAADVHVTKLDNESLNVSVTGAADLHLSGKTDNLSLSATGAADVHAFKLASHSANVTITGPSDANISVDGSLTVTIVGAGDVNYKGDAKVTKTIIGDGDVNKVRVKNKA
ncbi:MAG: DUF2807 domain-containing protein [Planctomycetes bacterium]|nr:DUF2807 domain-containing protein [Planctomycetota bacterium]